MLVCISRFTNPDLRFEVIIDFGDKKYRLSSVRFGGDGIYTGVMQNYVSDKEMNMPHYSRHFNGECHYKFRDISIFNRIIRFFGFIADDSKITEKLGKKCQINDLSGSEQLGNPTKIPFELIGDIFGIKYNDEKLNGKIVIDAHRFNGYVVIEEFIVEDGNLDALNALKNEQYPYFEVFKDASPWIVIRIKNQEPDYDKIISNLEKLDKLAQLHKM